MRTLFCCLTGLLAMSLHASPAMAQGASPETAPSLYPGGALISYNSVFTTRSREPGSLGSLPGTARPSYSQEATLNFTWGFHRDFDLTVLVPTITNHFQRSGTSATMGGTGLGDASVLVKYRFYRRDSPRGTAQASITLGPKIPTGATHLSDLRGGLLPAGLQPGSGSTDLFLGVNGTYTGLFGVKRLVADEDFHALLRFQGAQATRLGSDFDSRFWLSYRPYESRNVAREWFIGPALTWLHSQDDRIAGATKEGSGGDVLLVGIATYVGVRPGTHLWLGADWDIRHSTGGLFMPVRHHISFGITQQFRLHFNRKEKA